MKKLLLNLTLGIAIVSIIVGILSCAVNPVTGEKEFMLLTEAGEIGLGKQTDTQIIESYGLYENPGMERYVSSIGQKMVKLSHRPDLAFSFKILDTPAINAFAVPGGFIYVTRGILSYLNNEAELAGVLGHEIGHVTARHSAKQYSKVALTQLGLALGTELSETFRKYAGISQFGVGMLFLKFSRDNERQADALGVEYSSKAGYDAVCMADFFETLGRLHPESASSGLPNWFSTHPNPPDRIRAVERDVRKWQTRLLQKQLAVNRDRYLKKLDGIIYGENPRQGYVKGNTFYHPQMKFQFPVPAKWKLNNTPSQVRMYTKSQDAVILFSLASGNSPAAAADKFIKGTKATVKSSRQIRVNGLLARRVVSYVPKGKATIPVISYFIRMNNRVFVFHGLSSKERFSSYLPVFKNTMGKFRRLTDQRKINVKPARLVIKKTTRQQTLRQALQEFGVPNDKMEKTAILNGKKLDAMIPANTLLKKVSGLDI